MSIAISTNFMEAFTKLPDAIQKRTVEFLEKFELNPQAPGFNFETINAAADKKIRSVRINDTYRAIVKREEETGTFILLWVDHHDEAYDWASSKRCELNPITRKVQIYSVEEAPAAVEGVHAGVPGLFSMFQDKDLMKIGVPKDQLRLVKSIKDYSSFSRCSHLLPDDVAENLDWIANDIPIEEVIRMAEEMRHTENPVSLAAALASGNSRESFVIVDGQEELRSIMNSSLEKWRVFLHPLQRDAVERDYSGPARVLGEAGTGKTVVAMHRAKRLCPTLKSEEKVLFTTFTANLAEDIKSNLRKICSDSEYARIEVTSLDSWIARFLAKRKSKERIVYGRDLDEYWDKAIAETGFLEFEKEFYKEEWASVVSASEAYSMEEYVQASRIGRGTKLDRTKRALVWRVCEEFMKRTAEDGVVDIDTAMNRCRKLIEQEPICNVYPSIIVDEGQDFSSNAYSLIRAVAGPEHKNDIFIVGDAHQRIYRRKTVLSRCGINIKGRSSHLRINYRTTEEIRKYAYSILTGISFDDLDGSTDDGRQSRSFIHGPDPVLKSFATQADETTFVTDEIQNLIKSGVNAKDICVVARTSRLLDNFTSSLAKQGIRSFEVKPTKNDDRNFDGVRTATMHRVKGLEFQYVFVVSVNQGIVPLNVAIDHTDQVSESETLKAERCLFYVALTRTQKCAYITNFGKPSPLLPQF